MVLSALEKQLPLVNIYIYIKVWIFIHALLFFFFFIRRVVAVLGVVSTQLLKKMRVINGVINIIIDVINAVINGALYIDGEF